MKLFFDARYLRTDYHDGISRYSAELGTALARLMKKTKAGTVTFLICDEGQRKWLPQDATVIKLHKPTSVKEPFSALFLNKYKPDVVYSPMQTIGTLGRRYLAVVTLHDMIYYRHSLPPKNLPATVRAGWRLYHLTYWPQRLLLKGADLVTTVSHASANDICQARMVNYSLPVVYNAPQRFHTYPVKHEKIIKNIVYMGSFMPYKNVETLIEAMHWLPGRNLHLLSRVSSARKAEYETIIARVGLTENTEGAESREGAKDTKVAKIVFHNGVSDDEYEKLLADNAVLVSASLDEGYGIPVADAMAMGVPVVISDIPVFHEVGGDGALYADPANPQSFAEAVQQLDSPIRRAEAIKKSQTHIRKFDWDTSAEALLKAIHARMNKS